MTEEKQSQTEQSELDKWIEMQNHLDPLHWMSGGRRPLHLLGKRPNKMGYYYLVVGVLMLILSALFAFNNSFVGAILFFLFSILFISLGFSLLRPSKEGNEVLQTEIAAANSTWTCTSCGEQIEHNFDACWNCGTDRDGTPPEDPNTFN